jgi:ABC-type amino acid transport substrate-binding protein/nitrogen-specific signal transduction histidine kinase/ActR/RegA family two-component response regulator
MHRTNQQGHQARSLFLFSFILAALVFTLLCQAPVHAEHQEKLKVRVGAYENHPKIYTNENGVLTGIFPDILENIAIREDWELEYVPGTLAQCFERLERNEIDIMVDVAFSEKRNEKYDFNRETIFIDWDTIFTRQGLTIKSPLDLHGKKVAVMKGSIHTDYEGGIKSLASLARAYEIDIDFLEVNSYKEIFELLDTGQVDAGVVNRLFGTLSCKDFAVVESLFIFNPRHLKFAFPKNNARGLQLRERIDSNLVALKIESNSVFYEIIDTYLSGLEFKTSNICDLKQVLFIDAEEAWLRAHKKIRIGVDASYAPYSFVDVDGSYQGIAMDFVDLISKELGVEMEVVPKLSWPQILDGARKRTLDVVITAVKTKEREEYLGFTKIYIPTPLVIMTRQETEVIDGPEDLADMTIALVKGYSSSERVSREHPDITPLVVETPLEGLQTVSAGEATGYVGVLGINDYLATKHGITNLKVAARYDMRTNGQRFAVRKDWPMLVTILDKVLATISEKQKVAIFNTWIADQSNWEGPISLQEEFALTDAETVWVDAHPVIRLGADPEFAPFEYFSKEGVYSGVASDYINILNTRLGLNMQVVPNLTWNEAVDKAKKLEIDVLPSVGDTEDRRSFLNFSIPYMNFHRVIITRTDTPFLAGLEDVRGLKVAVQANTSHTGYLKEHSDIEPQLYETLQEALVATSEGSADAFIGNIASATYWIRKQNLTNLKVAAPVSQELQGLHFAVRSDWPELVGIINKGLQSISLAKENQIRRRWITVEYAPGLDPGTVKKFSLQIIGIVLLVLLGIVAWNYRLTKEIRKRKIAENALHQAHERLEHRVKERTAALAETNKTLQQEISERHQTEKEKDALAKQLLQVQKMEAIGTLAGGIAHDFNNILTPIIGYAEMALEEVPLDSISRGYLKEILNAGGRARNLVKQILTFSHRTEQEKKPVQLEPIIREALKLLRSSIPTTIKIQESIDPDSRASILADPTQIHQIIMNLCTNAYHAMREHGGVLSVSLAEVEFDQDDQVRSLDLPPGRYLRLEVSDTGPGIEPALRERIFDPYFTTKTKDEGTGLGLALVHGIVKDHNGRVTLYSEMGRGTTFHVYLPEIIPSLFKEGLVEEEIVGGSERILLVDDEEIIVLMQKRILESLGYKVTAFLSSVETLESFKEAPGNFDLVMTDMTMPEMTGAELAVKLLDIRPDIPIILCSGFSNIINKDKAKLLGIREYIMKPVAKKQLAVAVRKLLDENGAGP